MLVLVAGAEEGPRMFLERVQSLFYKVSLLLKNDFIWLYNTN